MRSGLGQESPSKFSPLLSTLKKKIPPAPNSMWAVFLFFLRQRGVMKMRKMPFAPQHKILHQSEHFCTTAPKNAPPVELIPRFYYYLLLNTKKVFATHLRCGCLFLFWRAGVDNFTASCNSSAPRIIHGTYSLLLKKSQPSPGSRRFIPCAITSRT